MYFTMMYKLWRSMLPMNHLSIFISKGNEIV